jgi:hypothetical protein
VGALPTSGVLVVALAATHTRIYEFLCEHSTCGHEGKSGHTASHCTLTYLRRVRFWDFAVVVHLDRLQSPLVAEHVGYGVPAECLCVGAVCVCVVGSAGGSCESTPRC